MEKFYFDMSLATVDEWYKKNRTLIHDAFPSIPMMRYWITFLEIVILTS